MGTYDVVNSLKFECKMTVVRVLITLTLWHFRETLTDTIVSYS